MASSYHCMHVFIYACFYLLNGIFNFCRFPSSVKASKPGKCDSISAKGSLASAKLNLPIDIPDQPETEIDVVYAVFFFQFC